MENDGVCVYQENFDPVIRVSYRGNGMTERAVFVTRTEHLPGDLSGYSRLYFGIEFCERLLPSKQELEAALRVAAQHNMQFTFVTPFVTDAGIETLKMLTDVLPGGGAGLEAVVNDFGYLQVLRQKGWRGDIALGRLLTKQKRGPRLMNVISRLSSEAVEHFRQSNIDAPFTAEFLMEKGISRVELDNLLQGISRSNPCFKASLYVPYAYVTTTRYCLSAGCEKPGAAIRTIKPCQKECQRCGFELSHPTMPVTLMLRGNTQFFKNDVLPGNLEELKIDRLVFQPRIPI